MVTEKEYIGPDPVVWVERLLDVNDGSLFTVAEQDIIRRSLHALRISLRRARGEV